MSGLGCPGSQRRAGGESPAPRGGGKAEVCAEEGSRGVQLHGEDAGKQQQSLLRQFR